MKSHEAVKGEVERATTNYGEDFLSRLAEKLGMASKASVVFADPVEREGITVIPVAKARWGFGGGAGRTKDDDGGVGGGGGAHVTPIGFIEIREGEATFRRITSTPLPLFAVGVLAGLLVVRSLFRRV